MVSSWWNTIATIIQLDISYTIVIFFNVLVLWMFVFFSIYILLFFLVDVFTFLRNALCSQLEDKRLNGPVLALTLTPEVQFLDTVVGITFRHHDVNYFRFS